MSDLENKAVDSFAWIGGASAKWGLLAAGTALLLVIILIVLVWCMKEPDSGFHKGTSELFKDDRYSSGPYTGMVAVPISCTNDGLGPTFGPPPPYSLAEPEHIQPGALVNERKSPLMFGYSPYAAPVLQNTGPSLAPPSSTTRPLSPPPNGSHSRPISPRPIDNNYSSFSEEEEEGCVGKIWFTALHDKTDNKLQVEVIKARILPLHERSNTLSESFVRVFLLPDEQISFQTKAKKRTMTPKFSEKFTFEVKSEEKLHTYVLRLSLYVLDRRNVRSCLGHVLLNLEDMDVEKGDVQIGDLQAVAQPSALGDINYSMNYHPSNEKLKINLIKCRNLRKLMPMPKTDFESPTLFIKLQIICGRKQLDQRMTKGLPANLDPEFNEVMFFSLTQKQLSNASIILTVMTSQIRGDDTYDEIYGSSTVGPFMFAHGEELRHWQEMLAKPRTSITKWHILH